MNDFSKFNVSKDVMDAMVSARNIMDGLGEDEISSLDFIISSLDYVDTKLYEYLDEKIVSTVDISPDVIMITLLEDKRIYETVTGLDYDNFIEKLKRKKYNIKLNGNNEEEAIFTIDLDLPSAYAFYSEELENNLLKAKNVAKMNGKDYIDLDTIIYCILEDKQSASRKMLREIYTDKNIEIYLKKDIKLLQYSNNLVIGSELDSFLNNLSDEIASRNEFDIVGRDEEVFKLWNIMSKKTKRNAILIGEPGVGKTAIIEAMTSNIISGKCPEKFKDYKVLSLDLNSMVAGTKYRGEFEQRVQTFIKFVKNNRNIIIFIDEIHLLLGTGRAEGSGPDLSGALKPILSRDDIILIGATTTDEYNMYFSKDGALKRRFELIVVKEPKIKDVKKMVSSRTKTLSNYHGVSISDEMLEKIIIYASSFSNIANPDRTIDLIDKAMAVAKIRNNKTLKEEHIKAVYKNNFKIYRLTPKAQKLSTAYHEAGHFAMWLLSDTKRNSDCILVSIVPAEEWLGVTMFEDNEIKKHEGNIKFLKESIAIDLGGRIAQKLVTNEIDSGASSDLDIAMNIAETFVMKYGMFDISKNYVYSDRSRLPISEKNSDEIRKFITDFVNEVYEETEKIVEKNKDEIGRVAELLMRKGIITAKEAKDAFYNKNKKEIEEVKKVVNKK